MQKLQYIQGIAIVLLVAFQLVVSVVPAMAEEKTQDLVAECLSDEQSSGLEVCLSNCDRWFRAGSEKLRECHILCLQSDITISLFRQFCVAGSSTTPRE